MFFEDQRSDLEHKLSFDAEIKWSASILISLSRSQGQSVKIETYYKYS